MLDPASLDCRIHYRIVADRTLDMASPRGGHLIPQLLVASEAIVI